MEPRFGHDFSKVRVHTDNRAAQSAALMGATAYAVGHDIVFAAGRYAPHTETGRELLAHELTHVVQQGEHSAVHTNLAVSRPGDPAETEADQIAAQVMHGQKAAPASQLTGLMLHRNPDVGFTVHSMNIDQGQLDDPNDAGGVVTWPLSFAVTSPIEVKPDVEVTGAAGDPCTDHSVGFLQTVHIQWIHIHYAGQAAGDGSSMLTFNVPLPIRDGEPGDMWYTADGVDKPAACNQHINPHMDDYPTLWDIPKVHANTVTGKDNYLTYITRGIHFVTTLADSSPAGVTPLRFFYWNYLMDIEFTPNYAAPNAVWPFNWKKNQSNVGKVHHGGDGSVPMFANTSKPYNQSLVPKMTENK